MLCGIEKATMQPAPHLCELVSLSTSQINLDLEPVNLLIAIISAEIANLYTVTRTL